MSTIRFSSKTPEYAWLSNFWRAPIFLDGDVWPTVEHFYQASKSNSEVIREKIRNLQDAASAKAIGRQIKQRKDFDRDAVMQRALSAKFMQHPVLFRRLLDTYPSDLHEDVGGKSNYWGMRGADRLGQLLTELRDHVSCQGGTPVSETYAIISCTQFEEHGGRITFRESDRSWIAGCADCTLLANNIPEAAHWHGNILTWQDPCPFMDCGNE